MKLNRKVASVLLAVTMFAGVLSVPAMADDGESTYTPEGKATETISFTKTISKEANVYMPAATFSFTIASVDGAPTDGATLTDSTITSAPKASDINATSVVVTDANGDNDVATISVDASKFSAPGVYKYTVTETAGTYETDIAYASQTKYLYVYIMRNETTDQMQVYSVNFANENNTTKDTNTFTNDYSSDHSNQKNYKVIKNVTGTMGDKNKDFSFTVTINAGTDGKLFNVVKTSKNGTPETISLNNEGKYSFTLQDSEYITIYGVSKNDTVSVVEDTYSDYTTNIGEAVVDNTTGDSTVTVTNNKDAATPTGLLMDVAPYAAMILLAAAAAFVFLRRRNSNED